MACGLGHNDLIAGIGLMLVLILGISDAGKTELCEAVIKTHPGMCSYVNEYRAFRKRLLELLYESGMSAVSESTSLDQLMTDLPDQVMSRVYPIAARVLISHAKGQIKLFDSHGIYPVGHGQFRVLLTLEMANTINPDAIILVTRSIRDIVSTRRVSDKPAARRNPTEEQVQIESTLEAAYVTWLAKELRCPMILIDDPVAAAHTLPQIVMSLVESRSETDL